MSPFTKARSSAFARPSASPATSRWRRMTGAPSPAAGFASRHDPDGDCIYGMDVCVDPDLRGLRIGQRLYNERRKLCQYLRLKGIVFAGRMPGLARRSRRSARPRLSRSWSRRASSAMRCSASRCATASSRSASCTTICRATRNRSALPCKWSGAIRRSSQDSRAEVVARASPQRTVRVGDGAVPAARGQELRGIRGAGRVFRRRRWRTTKPTSRCFRNCSRCNCCRSTTQSAVAAESIARADRNTPNASRRR